MTAGTWELDRTQADSELWNTGKTNVGRVLTQVWPAFYEPLDLRLGASTAYRANQSADGLTFTEFSNKGGVLKLANVILCIVDDAGATNYLAPFVYVELMSDSDMGTIELLELTFTVHFYKEMDAFIEEQMNAPFKSMTGESLTQRERLLMAITAGSYFSKLGSELTPKSDLAVEDVFAIHSPLAVRFGKMKLLEQYFHLVMLRVLLHLSNNRILDTNPSLYNHALFNKMPLFLDYLDGHFPEIVTSELVATSVWNEHSDWPYSIIHILRDELRADFFHYKWVILERLGFNG